MLAFFAGRVAHSFAFCANEWGKGPFIRVRCECVGDATLEARHIWQRRFYDFVLSYWKKLIEKLRYIHRYTVNRALVAVPEDWR